MRLRVTLLVLFIPALTAFDLWPYSSTGPAGGGALSACQSCHGSSGLTVSFPSATAGLYPGQSQTFYVNLFSGAASAARAGTNVAATGGILGVASGEPLTVSGGEVVHTTATYPLKVLGAAGTTAYWFTYKMPASATPGSTSYVLNAAGAAGHANYGNAVGAGSTASTSPLTVNAVRPANPAALTPATASSSAVSLTWSGTGPAYRLVGKTGAYPTSPSDGTILQDLATTSTTVSGLSASTTYFFRVWARAVFDGTTTDSSGFAEASVTTAPAAVTTWYVNVATGSDANSGTSPDTPFKTITKAMSVAVSGEWILVAPGTYSATSGETFPIVVKSGVQLKSSDGALVTIIDASAASPRKRVLECYGNASSTLIEGFTITGGFHQPPANDFSNAAGGGIYCDFNDATVVSRNIIKGNEARGRAGTNTSRPGGYAMGGGVVAGSGTTLVNNVIRENTARGGTGYSPIAIDGGDGGTGGDAVAGGVYGGATVINNTFYANVARGGDGGGNGGGGIGGAAGSGQGGGLAYSESVVNNIFSTNTAASGTPGPGQSANNSSCCGAQAGGGNVDHNLFFASTPGDPNVGTNAITGADPQFVSTADLQIQPASPANGAGTATGAPAVDLEGTTRPVPPSMGAYEPQSAAKRRGDFDADSRSDLLWRNQPEGATAVWLMNGLTITATGYLTPVVSSWSIVGVDDFNGDGRSDILWRNTSGEVALWLMDGFTIIGGGSIGVPSSDWVLQGVGDFDGNGKADILWRNSGTSEAVVWMMDGTTIVSAGSVASPSSEWSVQGVGDFNGDARTDILWRNSASNEAWAWLMDGAAIGRTGYVASPPPIWVVKGVGDFSGDSRADILWRNTDTNQVVVWVMNGTAISSTGYVATPPSMWDIRSVGDYDGDSRADMMWRNTDTGENVLWLMNGTSISSSGYLPTVADQNWTVAGPR